MGFFKSIIIYYIFYNTSGKLQKYIHINSLYLSLFFTPLYGTLIA